MFETRHTRRTFIKKAAAGAVGAGLASSFTAASYARIVGANDRVRVGVVGFSDRAKHSLLPAFQAHAGDLNMELVAVSDIWNRRREEGVAYVKEKFGKDITAVRNNEELYDTQEIDAVIISTADITS